MGNEQVKKMLLKMEDFSTKIRSGEIKSGANEKFTDIHPNLMAMPSLTLIIGSVRSGKSNLLVNYFCNPSFFFNRFDTVKFISSTLHTDNKGKILSKHFDCLDHYEDGIIESIKKESFRSRGKLFTPARRPIRSRC